MPKKTKTANTGFDAPILTIKLQRGLAERNMLPVEHVIRVLEEIRQMVSDVGREIQRDMGLEKIKPDFGLELLADGEGMVFQKGSLQAHIGITSNVQTGLLAAHRIVETIEALGEGRYVPATEADRTIIRRLNRVAQIQETDKTELQVTVKRPGKHKAEQATFNEAAAEVAWAIQAPVFQMEDMTVYGKLYELKAGVDDEDNRGFWGELHRGNDEIWRIQFKKDDVDKVASLFGKQVSVRGTAKYYRIAAPKLIAQEIAAERERDYERAFDELLGCDKDIYPNNLSAALQEMRGDD